MKYAIVGSVGNLVPAGILPPLFRVLQERGLWEGQITGLAASSGSAPWCALAAAGLSWRDIWIAALDLKERSMYQDPNFQRLLKHTYLSLAKHRMLPGWTGLMMGDRIREWLYQYIGHITFGELPLPLHIVTYHLNERRRCVFNPFLTPDVEVAKAARASTAIPGGYWHEIIALGGRESGFWDGGVTDTIPITVPFDFPPTPDLVIAVDAAGAFSPRQQPWKSLADMDFVEHLQNMLDARVDASNQMALVLAQQKARIEVLTVRVRADIDDPGGTIPAALQAGYEDATALVDRIF